MAQQTISKMETVQTAVDWLQERYNQGNDYERHLTESEFEQAKQMEKEQIINAWRNGDNDSMYDFKELDELAEEYYNETYGSNNQI